MAFSVGPCESAPHALVGLGASAASAAVVQADTVDSDGDTLPDEWETAFGLNPQSAAEPDGADGDPDGDGLTNSQEHANGTHPRGLFRRYFAEGAQSDFFQTRLGFANGFAGTDARVLVTFLGPYGERVPVTLLVPAQSQRHLLAADIPNLPGDFAISVEADFTVAVERTMTWDARGYGSHAESGVARPQRQWYLAEGATGGPFSLYYLISNPNAAPASVTITYLLPAPQSPIVKTYGLAPQSRRTIWVDLEAPELATTDVGAIIESDIDVVVERAMYRDTEDALGAGHAAAAVPAPATSWFLAEGATGSFFDLYVLIANPGDQAADLEVSYLLPTGPPLVKTYHAEARSRTTLAVDHEDPLLAATAVSVQVRSLNDVPVVVERAMWWPDGVWYEAHASAGTVTTGTRWLTADAEVGGTVQADTYVLVANTSTCPAVVAATLLFPSDPPVTRQFTVPASSRFNLDLRGEFPEALDRRFGVLVESVGEDCVGQFVVERATYTSANGVLWSGGVNTPALDVSPLLLPQEPIVLHTGTGPFTIDIVRPGGPPATLTAATSDPTIATVAIDPGTGQLTIVPGPTAQGKVAVTLTAAAPGVPSETKTLDVFLLRPAQFSAVTKVGPRMLFPAVADLDKDGWPEFLGAMNDGTGTLAGVDVTALGFGPLVDEHRDNRLADLNGDGWLDIISGYFSGVHQAPVTRLFINNGNNTWHEDAAFRAMAMRGYIHTIVVADFDNDGDLDIFMPVYTQNDPSEQFFLLMNDGTARFTEVADAAGISSRGWPYGLKTEGAHAVDFNGDGWIDVYTASRFFFNNGLTNGIPTFTDRATELGLPLRYDEGLKFLDWNNDGTLDLMKHSEWTGPYLYEFDGQRFTERFVFPSMSLIQAYGVNVADINSDGYEDVVTAGGTGGRTAVLLNAGGTRFVWNDPSTIDGWWNDCLAFGDFNRDGLPDIAKREVGLLYTLNTTAVQARTVVVEVVGDHGELNQHGRVVRVTPLAHPEITYTRIVDGGSGYIAQSEYPITIATEVPGPYRVVVQFNNGPVEFVMEAGQRRRVSRTGQIDELP